MTKFPSAAPTYDPEFIPEDEQDNRLDWSVNDAQAANTESSAYAYSCLAEHWNNFIRLCDEKSVDTSSTPFLEIAYLSSWPRSQ